MRNAIYFQDPGTGVDMVLHHNRAGFVAVEVSLAVGPFPSELIREAEITARDMTLDIETEGFANDEDLVNAARMLRSRDVSL